MSRVRIVYEQSQGPNGQIFQWRASANVGSAVVSHASWESPLEAALGLSKTLAEMLAEEL